MLLDTHIALWLAIEEGQLSQGELALLAAADRYPLFSAVSIWELRLKWTSLHPSGHRKGLASPEAVLQILRNSGFEELPITSDDAATELEIPLTHKDLFDELLMAQAQAHRLRLLTRDALLSRHPLAISA